MSRRWEYLTIEIKAGMLGNVKAAAVQAELARHGQMGWELVNITHPSSYMPALLVFKKEV